MYLTLTALTGLGAAAGGALVARHWRNRHRALLGLYTAAVDQLPARPMVIPPGQIKAHDRVRIGPAFTALVRHCWETDNWVYLEVEELWHPLMLEPISTVTIERPAAITEGPAR
jgi:squalene cyclase